MGGIAQAAGAVASASIQAGATKTAANDQLQAANNSLNFEKQTYQTQQTNAAPYLQEGQQGLNALNSTASFSAPTEQQAENTPDYQFQLQQGQQALQRAQAATGITGGGAAKEIAQYSQGLADSNYQQTYQNALNTYDTNLGKTVTEANMGLAANNQAASAAQNFGNNAASISEQQGNAAAAGATGLGNALSGLSSSLSSIPGLNALFSTSSYDDDDSSGWVESDSGDNPGAENNWGNTLAFG